MRTDNGVLAMLGALPKQKYIHVYIEDKLDTLLTHLVDTNEDEIAWIDEDETVWFDVGDNVDSTVINVKTARNDETVRKFENVRMDEIDNIEETVRNYQIVGNETEFNGENSSEDDDYVVSNHEDSDNPLKDSENDLVDNGDEVCDVHVGVGVGVGVGRDIPGFSTAMGENEEMDNETRDKPIFTMLEMIRCKIINIFAKKTEEAQKIVGPLCPKIQKKVDALLVQSEFCVHVITVIIMRGERPEGSKQWPCHVTNEPIFSLVIRRPIGRPQRNRRNEANEILTSTRRMQRRELFD
ncbi:hypothetical protein GQ457_02G019140 [Hibiscus cannabinus]